MTILQDQTKTAAEDMLIELMLLREENAKLKAGKNGNGITIYALGTSNKDGVPYKGTLGVKLGRHSAVYYPDQWLKLLDMADDIRKAIEDNKAKLSWKTED